MKKEVEFMPAIMPEGAVKTGALPHGLREVTGAQHAPELDRSQVRERDSDTLRGLIRLLHSDYRRYRACGDGGWFCVLFLSQGFLAGAHYRVSKYLLSRVKLRPARRALRALLVVSQKMVEVATGICITAECEIGEGFYIGHFGQIFVLKDTPFGRYSIISLGVTFGIGGRGEKRGCPKIGDRVYLGPNAILFGDITIGDDAAIGAGAVVTKSVPPRGNVLGNPARVVGMEGSFDFIEYDGMDEDPDRLESMRQVAPLGREINPG
jgi:serine O-acetyltransferase